jgi:hypothetical protein
MPKSSESGCAPGYFILDVALANPGVAGQREPVRHAVHRGYEVGSRGYRRRPHPEGTLGCGEGAPPARGEAGQSMAAPHGGPGV